jgi:L-fuconolactonase
VKGVRLLGELGLSYDLLVSPGQIRDAARLVDACPHTHFILDHCGNPDVQAADLTGWEQEIAELAKRKRVVCKVSGFVASAKPKSWKPEDLEPIVRYVMDVFGSERVMYGGDWPVCTKVTSLQKWTQALAFAARIYEPQDQAKLFYDNAARVYGLH